MVAPAPVSSSRRNLVKNRFLAGPWPRWDEDLETASTAASSGDPDEVESDGESDDLGRLNRCSRYTGFREAASALEALAGDSLFEFPAKFAADPDAERSSGQLSSCSLGGATGSGFLAGQERSKG